MASFPPQQLEPALPVELLSAAQLETLFAQLQAQMLAVCGNDRQRLAAYNRLLTEASTGAINRQQLQQRVGGERKARC